MIRFKIRDVLYKVIDGYDINESSREVKFSNLKIDFTNKTIADLPVKYQECQLVEIEDGIETIIYTGYINNFILPNIKNRYENRELEIELLSPLAMATVRTIDAVGTYNLQPLVKELIQPLINDGFVLKEFNISNNQITVNYLMETIESALNKISNKYNIWWYIDENKNIYINSISYLLSKKPIFDYNVDNKISGLIDVIPSIDAVDYCNTINFTNLRMYVDSYYFRWYDYNELTQQSFVVKNYSNPLIDLDYIKQGDEIEFKFPIVIGKKIEKEVGGYLIHTYSEFLKLSRIKNDRTYEPVFNVYYDNDEGQTVLPNNVSIDDSYSEINTWVLVRDAFFKNLIVGMKYNGTSTIEIGRLTSGTGLTWAKVKILDEAEINKNKNVISRTGIVEKQINMNEQWKTYNEVIDIANSYVKNNDPKVETVVLNMDENHNFKIGDIIKINQPDFFINDVYIITDKKTSHYDNETTWGFTLKNTNLLESYIDLFRAGEKEEETDKFYTLTTGSYIEEGFKERYEVSENES